MLSITWLDFEFCKVPLSFSFGDESTNRNSMRWHSTLQMKELEFVIFAFPFRCRNLIMSWGALVHVVDWRLAIAVIIQRHRQRPTLSICVVQYLYVRYSLLLTPLLRAFVCTNAVSVMYVRFSLWLRVKSTQGYYCTLKRISHVCAMRVHRHLRYVCRVCDNLFVSYII